MWRSIYTIRSIFAPQVTFPEQIWYDCELYANTAYSVEIGVLYKTTSSQGCDKFVTGGACRWCLKHQIIPSGMKRRAASVRRDSLPAGTASQSEVQPRASMRSPWKLQSGPRPAYGWLQAEPRLRRPPMVRRQIPALAGICGCTIRGSNTGGCTSKSAGTKPTHPCQEVWRSRVTKLPTLQPQVVPVVSGFYVPSDSAACG